MMTITYEEVIERMNVSKVNKVYVLATIIAALGGFLFGYDTAIISTTLIFVEPIFHLGTAALSTTGLLLIIWRTLIGFSIGADTAIATGYISEFSPTKVRGRLGITQQLMIFSGFTAAFWAGYFLSFSANWRWMYGLGAIPAVVLLGLRFYLPESPRWLLIQGKVNEAKAALKRFGLDIKEDIATPIREKGFRELMANKSVRTAILLVGFWLAFQQITGVNIILYFGPAIYKYIGLTGPRAILNTAISESLGAIEYAISFMLIDKWGRRRLGVVGYSGLVGSLILMLVGINYFNSHVIFLAVVFIFSAMTLFLLFFHIGVGGVGWVLQGETLPTEFRGRGMGILAAVDWIANFIIIFIFPYWKATYGIFSFFVFELALSIVAILVIALFFPETKNVPLEQMPDLFSRRLRDMRKPYVIKESKISTSGQKK